MSSQNGARRPATLQLTLPCDLAKVRPASQEVASFLATQGCDENELMTCGIALVEACNNAIRYAPPEARQLPISIEALASEDTIEIRVTDHTHGFEWPHKIALPAPDSESGRGLYLITSLSHRAGYLRGQDENVLHFSRRRTSTPATAPSASFDALCAKLAEDDRVITKLIEELSSAYESLSAIFRHSTATHEAGKLKTLAEQLLNDLLQIVGGEWFLVRLALPEPSRLAVFVASDPSLELDDLQLATSGAPLNCAEVEAAVHRHEVWFDTRTLGGSIDPLAHARPSAQGLVHPFYAGGSLIGTLTIGRGVSHTSPADPQSATVFTAGQASVIGTLADFLAIQVVNARSQEEQMQSRVVARELDIANNIQRSLLPKQLPTLPGLELAAYCENARQVGGDFYDVLPLDDSSLLLVIADVMGKGVPAAMFAAILRTVLRASPELSHQPARLLTRANHLLFDELSGVNMFITAQLALVDARERKLTLANAGHCPLLLCTTRAPGFAILSPEGMPLGVQQETVFQEQTIGLGDSFRVLLYTDGLTEALDAEGNRYGQENLECWFGTTAWHCRTAEALKAALAQEMRRYRGSQPLSDDQTFLAMTNTTAT